MASTYSDRLRIELIGTGEQSGIWGNTTNTNLGTLIEEAIAGVATISMSDADYTLTTANGATDQARQAVLVLTGTLSAARNVICPDEQKVYIVKNTTTGGFAVMIKTSAGTGVSVPNGGIVLVYCDATNVYLAADVSDTTDPTFTGNISLDGAVVINDSGADKDFRVEGDGDANLIFADASTDRVGIGTNTPTVKLDVSGDVSLNGAVVINDAGADKDTRIEGDNDANLFFADASTDRIGIGTNTPTVKFDVSGDASLNGAVVINEAGADKDTRIEGDTDTNLFFADASTDRVGIGTNTPTVKLDVSGDVSLNGAVVINDAGADKDTRIEGDNDANLIFVDASVDRVGLGTGSPASKLDISGNVAQNIVAVSASAVDCSAGNYFTKTASGALTWTTTNIPASRSYSFILELTNGGTGTQTWMSGIKWPGGAAPTLTASGVDVLGFITDDGGTTWRGVQLMKDSK